jgi:hypothetical protein
MRDVCQIHGRVSSVVTCPPVVPTTLHYTTLHYTTLHYTTLHYTTLHYTTLHYTTLHYNCGCHWQVSITPKANYNQPQQQGHELISIHSLSGWMNNFKCLMSHLSYMVCTYIKYIHPECCSKCPSPPRPPAIRQQSLLRLASFFSSSGAAKTSTASVMRTRNVFIQHDTYIKQNIHSQNFYCLLMIDVSIHRRHYFPGRVTFPSLPPIIMKEF